MGTYFLFITLISQIQVFMHIINVLDKNEKDGSNEISTMMFRGLISENLIVKMFHNFFFLI